MQEEAMLIERGGHLAFVDARAARLQGADFASLSETDILRMALDAADEAIYVIDPQTLRYVYFNEAACSLIGRDRADIMEKGAIGMWAMSGGEESELRQHYQDVIASPGDPVAVRTISRRPDGSVVHMSTRRLARRIRDQWFILSCATLLPDEETGAAEMRRWLAAIEKEPDAIALIEFPSMRCIGVNERTRTMLELPRQELLERGSQYLDVMDPSERSRLYAGLVRATPRAQMSQARYLAYGCREVAAQVTRQAVHVDGRWIICLTAQDITERLRAEDEVRHHIAELARSNQDLEQFAYVTSHDLSEPLRTMQNYTELLARRYADRFDDDGREFMDFIVGGAQRMKRLIDDLLRYSRAGRPGGTLVPVSMDLALDDALANLERATHESSAVIEHDPLPVVLAEKTGMTQLFQNLVGNALKFRGTEPPRIRVSISDRGSEWTVSVTDNGIGIAPQYFDRIFVIFQRLHARDKYEGTGIGLSICKKIAARHGGRMWVESEPGKGSTFHFTIPKIVTATDQGDAQP